MYAEVKIVWKFCKPLREQAMQIIDFEKKENDVINKQSINHILTKKLSHLKKWFEDKNTTENY